MRDLIIVDFEGTLTVHTNTAEFLPRYSVINLLKSLSLSDTDIFILADSREVSRTTIFLNKYEVPHTEVFWLDFKYEANSKSDWYKEYPGRGSHKVLAVFEDRDLSVRMWRLKLNLPCYQVDYGSY